MVSFLTFFSWEKNGSAPTLIRPTISPTRIADLAISAEVNFTAGIFPPYDQGLVTSGDPVGESRPLLDERATCYGFSIVLVAVQLSLATGAAGHPGCFQAGQTG